VLQTIFVNIESPKTGGLYPNDEDDVQTFTHPGAEGLRVHFDVFQTEDWGGCLDGGCDNVYLTNGDGVAQHFLTGMAVIWLGAIFPIVFVTVALGAFGLLELIRFGAWVAETSRLRRHEAPA